MSRSKGDAPEYVPLYGWTGDMPMATLEAALEALAVPSAGGSGHDDLDAMAAEAGLPEGGAKRSRNGSMVAASNDAWLTGASEVST
mgnify:CR=1 FL=1